MKAEKFIELYEIALGTQDWKEVAPLISANSSVTFSDGTVHHGKVNVQKAFEKNFSTIKNEKYKINNITWIIKDELYAVYSFDFEWTGLVNGDLISGSGYGTTVIRKEKGTWRLITEHLGRKKRT